MRFLTLALTLLPTFALSAPLELRADTSLPNPLQDPFYKVPANIGTYQPGQVVNKRDVVTFFEGQIVKDSYQISYRSATTKGDADLTVATVWVPKSPISPVRIVSYQAYQDSTVLDCVPSWAFTSPTASQNTALAGADFQTILNSTLSMGAYLVSADHQGSQSSFISGRQQGQAVLDGIRAIINSEKLPADSKVALIGYSGGASATVWAENQHSFYAPEINIVGSSSGGTPIDSRNLINFLNKGLFAGLGGAGLVGISNAYPELAEYIQQIATPEGKTGLAKYKSSGYCQTQVVGGDIFRDFFKYFNVSNPLDQPIPKQVLAQETLLTANAADPSKISTPKFPRYKYHGALDFIVPYNDEAAYIKQQCATGGNIVFNTLSLGGHSNTGNLALPSAIDFISQAFEGKTPKVFCGTSIPLIDLHSLKAISIIGANAVKNILGLNGKESVFGETIKL